MIQYVVGDATRPQGEGSKIIAHVCNDRGGWGAGFVVALSRRWWKPESAYRRAVENHSLVLGDVHFVQNVESDLMVANMIAQAGYNQPGSDTIPLRYEALKECLQKVADYANYHGASVHMPRIGCGLAGGKWAEVEKLIDASLIALKVPVTVYDLP